MRYVLCHMRLFPAKKGVKMKITVPEKWDMEYDVVVVGWGSAGNAGGAG
jgi:hypothetical protein